MIRGERKPSGIRAVTGDEEAMGGAEKEGFLKNVMLRIAALQIPRYSRAPSALLLHQEFPMVARLAEKDLGAFSALEP
jgi:hypothetical protein